MSGADGDQVDQTDKLLADPGSQKFYKTNGFIKNGHSNHIEPHAIAEEYHQPPSGPIDSKTKYDYESDIKKDTPNRAGIDGTTTALGGTFIVSNAAIGCGALAFAHAFKEAGGLYVGVVMIFVCACLCALSLLIVGYVCGLCRASEFHEMGKELLGWVAELLLQLCLVMANLAACTMYFVIIGDQLELIFRRVTGDEFFCSDPWYFNRKLTIVASTLLFVYPLLLVEKVDFLKYPSLISVGSMVYLMIAVVIKYFMDGDEVHQKVELNYQPDHWYSAFNAFPTILFGYQCMTNCPPVYANLKDKSPNTWLKISGGTIFICTVVYLPTALFGYLTHGTQITSNILKSYDPDETLIFIGQIGVMASVMMTYPVVFFVARNALDPMYTSVRVMFDTQYDAMDWATKRRIIEATVWYIVTLVLALFIPNIGVAMNFAGSVAVFFYFVFPGAFLVKIGWSRKEELGDSLMKIVVVIGIVLFAFGCALFVQGNYQALAFVLTSQSEPGVCDTLLALNSSESQAISPDNSAVNPSLNSL